MTQSDDKIKGSISQMHELTMQIKLCSKLLGMLLNLEMGL